MKVRRIRAGDWEVFRDIRLEALRSDPAAFGSTAEREEGYPEQHWKERAVDGASGIENVTLLGEAPDGRLLGMAGVFTENDQYHVWGMWVAPDFRGRGLGRKLLDEILSWARSADHSRPIYLAVNPDQSAAVRLYKSRGFQHTGETLPLSHCPGAFCQVMRRGPS
jgi:ribosomal protein S18 acetylase RimI-like enzyme